MRYVTFQFTIPFDGGAADTAERMIRDRVTHSLLNSLSSIHPDIRARVSNLPIEKVASAPAGSPNGEQTREQLLERLALTVKEAIDGGAFDGTLFESQVSGTLWLLYGERSPASRSDG